MVVDVLMTMTHLEDGSAGPHLQLGPGGHCLGGGGPKVDKKVTRVGLKMKRREGITAGDIYLKPYPEKLYIIIIRVLIATDVQEGVVSHVIIDPSVIHQRVKAVILWIHQTRVQS